MYQVPGVASSDVPFSVVGNQVIVGVECRLRDVSTGDIITITDELGNIVYTVTLTNTASLLDNTLNIN